MPTRTTVHPAADGVRSSTPAVPYAPYCSDPLPKRPREIICELMHYEVPVAADTHLRSGTIPATDKMFMSALTGLVSNCRSGQLELHLAVGRDLNIVPRVGTISAKALYTWGNAMKTQVYMDKLALRRTHQRVEQGLPGAVSVRQGALVRLHRQMESIMVAELNRARKIDEERIAKKVAAVARARRRMETEIQRVRDEFAPVSGYKGPGAVYLLDRCLKRARAEGEIGREPPTQQQMESADARYSDEVRSLHLQEYYRDERTAAAMDSLVEAKVATFQSKGDTKAEWWRAGR